MVAPFSDQNVVGEAVGGDDDDDGGNGGGFICSVAEVLAIFSLPLLLRQQLEKYITCFSRFSYI